MKRFKVKYNKIIISIFFILVIILSYTVAAISIIKEDQIINEVFSTKINESLPYNGYLRIYVVEPTSRWNNIEGEPYHFGFLDFAFNDLISIDYQENYTDSIIWNGLQEGFDDISENNIMVMAAIFNQEINKGFSNPPLLNPFEAHYVDAAAGVLPGSSASNIVKDNYTHTVFVEEATVAYCPYCPAMANALFSVYESGDFPFYFVALITKDIHRNVLNQIALDYLVNQYNLYAYPSAHIDGGKSTVVGGHDNPEYYSIKIENSGERDVHELDFTLSLEWIGDAELKIDFNIKNNEEFFNSPPEIPIITGPTSGQYGEEHTFEITASDPDNNDIYYYIDWGNGTIEKKGPYDSGKTINVKHTWNEKGKYTIRVRSRDIYDEKSDWATLEVSMPLQLLNIRSSLLNNNQRFITIISKILQY